MPLRQRIQATAGSLCPHLEDCLAGPSMFPQKAPTKSTHRKRIRARVHQETKRRGIAWSWCALERPPTSTEDSMPFMCLKAVFNVSKNAFGCAHAAEKPDCESRAHAPSGNAIEIYSFSTYIFLNHKD